MKNEVKVGDILQGMWHYSMHYPVWFRIVSVSNKTAKAERLFSLMVQPTDGGYGQQGYEMPDETRMNWEQDMESIKEYRGYNVPVKINGTLGLWWGRPVIEEVEEESVWDAIQRCLRDADDATVKYNDGRIEVEAMHHDGTNCFTISRADGKRFKYLYA